MARHLERIQNREWVARARASGHWATRLAQSVRVSVRQLERHFEEHRGCTPRVWLIQTRLDHAKELLRQGLSDKEVAPAVGLGSNSTLCHFFFRNTKLTPQQYLAARKGRQRANGHRIASRARFLKARRDFDRLEPAFGGRTRAKPAERRGRNRNAARNKTSRPSLP